MKGNQIDLYIMVFPRIDWMNNYLELQQVDILELNNYFYNIDTSYNHFELELWMFLYYIISLMLYIVCEVFYFFLLRA